MENVLYLDSLKPADRLVLPKSTLNLIQHHVIYLGKNAYGKRIFIENAINKGVQLIDEAYLFRDGYYVTRVERFKGTEQERIAAVKLAQQLLGTKYDLINFNCEHYANRIQHNNTYSKQVGTGFLAGMLLLVGALALNAE